MSKRIETIKRLAETDPYWKGYIDGMNRTREADAAEYAEYARLMQARLARTGDPADYDNEWEPARNGSFDAYLETSAALAGHEDDEPTPNAADLGAPRVP